MIIVVQMVSRLLAFRKLLKSPAVNYKDIEPAIVVVIEQSDAAARRRKQEVLILMTDQNRLRKSPASLATSTYLGK